MSHHEKRVGDLEKHWRQPPSWKVWFAEETAVGQLVEVWTGAAVQPGPNDTVVVIGECPSGLSRKPGDAHDESREATP